MTARTGNEPTHEGQPEAQQPLLRQSPPSPRKQAGSDEEQPAALLPAPLQAWKSSAQVMGRFGSLALYMTVAVAMNFVNKYTMQVYPLQNVVLALQMLATIAVLLPLLLTGVLDFPAWSWTRATRLLGVTLLYTGNSALALCGLKTLNIPMYHTLKRITPIITLLAKAAWTRRAPSLGISGSVLLVVAGCIIAGLGDLSFDLAGYMYALASALLQSAYLVLIELQGASGISTEELLYYNALNSLPFLGGAILLLGEHRQALPLLMSAIQQHGLASTVWAITLCAMGGLLLNFSMFLCTVCNGAVTLTVFGALRGVMIVVLGFFLLGGVQVTWLFLLGISINLTGGCVYSWLHFREKANRHQ